MTTIVYSHEEKVIAYDSRLVRGGQLIESENYEKTYKENDVTFFYSGNPSDINRFAKCYFDGKCEYEHIPNIHSFVFDGGKLYTSTIRDDGCVDKVEVVCSTSIGSGGEFALAALDHGKTARQAVEYAATRDIYTGGEIKVFSLDDNK